MGRREDFIKRMTEDKGKANTPAVAGETPKQKADREYFENKAAEEAKSAEEARIKRIQHAENNVDELERIVNEYESLIADAEAFLKRLNEMEAYASGKHIAAIKSAGMGFPDERRTRAIITVEEQGKVIYHLKEQLRKENNDLEEIYKILLAAGKMPTAKPDAKKRGLFNR